MDGGPATDELAEVAVNVSAIIVTRGDVDLDEILASLDPDVFERLVWDNGSGELRRHQKNGPVRLKRVDDLAVYGRYAAIKYATHDLIYVQDDDVLHATEGVKEIVDTWVEEGARRALAGGSANFTASEGEKLEADLSRYFVVCNMPANFRHAFYAEHALVGFGACFHRDAPERAFRRWDQTPIGVDGLRSDMEVFRRTCDIIFTALTPRVLVDVPYEDMPWASAENRMWKQSYHVEERTRVRNAVLEFRDAG